MDNLSIKEVVCLHYKPAEERVIYVENLKKLLKQELNFDLKVYQSVPLPHFDKIANYHRLTIANSSLIDTRDTFYDRVNVFNCSLSWYTILKGLQNNNEYCNDYYLLFEDDVIINDIQQFKNIIKAVPEDCNILRISCDNIDYDYVNDYNEYLYKQVPRSSYTNWRCGSTACFILDQKGINHCCKFIETNGYFPADHMLMNITEDLSVYIAKICPVSNDSFIQNVKSYI